MARNKSIPSNESTYTLDSNRPINRPCKGFGYHYRSTPSPVEECDSSKEKINRPARRIGVLLALQQVDGVDGTLSSLFKGQYDERFGDFDPASDIHTDPHLFRSELMRAGYDKTFNPNPGE